MNKKILLRILIDILLMVSVIHGWWFFVVPLGLIGAYLFLYFVEIIIAGVVYDSLFGLIPEMGIKGHAGIITVVIILGIVSGVKKVVRK